MGTVIEQMNSIGERFVEFAGPMLLQSSMLILILLIVDFALRKKVRAVFRYWIWMLVLVKLVLPTSLSSPFSLGYWLGDKLPAVDIQPSSMEPERVEPAPIISPPIIDLTNFDMSSYTPPVEPVLPVTEPVAFEPTAPAEAPVTPVKWQGIAFLAWLAVVVAMGLLLLQRALFVRGLVAQARKANRPMSEALGECRRCIGVRRKVSLKVSPNATTPAVCGLFRPVILVPQNLRSSLDSRHLRTVLLHELVHIKRGDLCMNLAQTALQIIYFYNPLLWLANAIIRRVREQAVDEAVLVAMGETAQQYPQTLVDVAKLAFKQPALSLRLIGVVESKGALTARIKHILSRPMPKSAKLGVLGLLAVLITAAVLLPMAAAGKDKEGTAKDISEGSEFTATLADGVRVELIGLCEVPNSGDYQNWWKPDGSPLENRPFKRSTCSVKQYVDRKWYCFAYSTSGSGYMRVIVENNSGSGSGMLIDENGEEIYSATLDHELSLLSAELNTTEMVFGFQGGPWKTLVKAIDRQAEIIFEGKYLKVAPVQLENDKLIVRAYEEFRKSIKDKRLDFGLIIEEDGKEMIKSLDRFASDVTDDDEKGVREEAYEIDLTHYDDIASGTIKGTCIRYFPIQFVTFRNVSLRPGSKTDVQIEVEEPVPDKLVPTLRVIDSQNFKPISDCSFTFGGWGRVGKTNSLGIYNDPEDGFGGRLIQRGQLNLWHPDYDNKSTRDYEPDKFGVVTILLDKGGSASLEVGVSLEVRGKQTNAPCRVRLFNADKKEVRRIESSHDRTYRFSGLAEGEYTIEAHFLNSYPTHYEKIKLSEGEHKQVHIDARTDQVARIRVAGKVINKRTGAGIDGAWIHFVGAPDDDAYTDEDGSFSTIADRAKFRHCLLMLDADKGRKQRLTGNPVTIDIDNHISEELARNIAIHIDPEYVKSHPHLKLRDENGDGIFCDKARCAVCDSKKNDSLRAERKPDVEVEVNQALKESDIQNRVLSFGPEVKRILGLDCAWIDLESGTTQIPPSKESSNGAQLQWCRESGVDVVGRMATGRLDCLDVEMVKLDDRAWTGLSVDGLSQELKGDNSIRLSNIDGFPAVALNGKSEKGTTYGFRTREGTLGLLKIDDLWSLETGPRKDNPNLPAFITILYKLALSPEMAQTVILERPLSIGEQQYLDLDSGEYVFMPGENVNPEHLKNQGVDIYLVLEKPTPSAPPTPMVNVLGMATERAPHKLYLQQVPANSDSLSIAIAHLNKPQRLRDYGAHSIHFFRTAQGKAGVMRVNWPSSGEPSKCLVRYRLLPALDLPIEKFPWGLALEGVQCRVRARKTICGAGEIPILSLDLRNRGKEAIDFVSVAQAHCEIQIDGAWYGWAEPIIIDAPVRRLEPATELNGAISIKLTNSWALPRNTNKLKHLPGVAEFWGKRLELTPGRHTVRVRFRTDDWLQSYMKNESSLSVVSNPVEITIERALPGSRLSIDEAIKEKDAFVAVCQAVEENVPVRSRTVPGLSPTSQVFKVIEVLFGKAEAVDRVRLDYKFIYKEPERERAIRKDERVIWIGHTRNMGLHGSLYGLKALPDTPENRQAVKAAASQAAMVWGEAVNGLRAAVEFVPEKESYEQGDVVGIRFHLQNVSNQTINLATPRWWIRSRCFAEDQLGVTIPTRTVPEPWGMTTIDRHKLLPGQVIKLESGSLAIVKDETQSNSLYKYPVRNVVTLKPGQYSLYYWLRFPGITRRDGDGKVIVPQPDDWQGALETGKRRLVIASAAGTGADAQTVTHAAVDPIGQHALSFDGVDDYLHVPANPTLKFKPPFSIEMWIKPDYSDIQRARASERRPLGLSLVRKGKIPAHGAEAQEAGGFLMTVGPSSARWPWPCSGRLFLTYASGYASQVDGFGGDRLELARPGWLHVCTCCTRETYVPVPDQPLLIGEKLLPHLLPFKGEIAEIRIWNKVLTDADLFRHAYTSLTGSEPNLMACWDFKRPGGQIVYDISPNRNHARLGSTEAEDSADPKWVKVKDYSSESAAEPDVQVETEKPERTSELRQLLKELEDVDHTKREEAARRLGELKDTRAVEALIAALKDGEVGVRAAAARALGKIADKRAVEPLVAAYYDQEYESFVDAIWALGDIGGTQAEEILVEALSYQGYHPYVPNIAAKCLAKLGWEPQTREQTVRYLIALDRWEQAIKSGPSASLKPEGTNQAEGPFELDIPIIIPLEADKQTPAIVKCPWLQFSTAQGNLKATLHMRYSSWPHTKWLMKVDVLDAGGKVLGQAESIHSNSGIIERIPHVENAEIPFEFDRGVELADAATFRFSIESFWTSQGNPIQFDKELPLVLELNAAEQSQTIWAQWVRFEKNGDQVEATIRLKYLSWPKARWAIEPRLLDQNGKDCGPTAIIENSGVIAGVPVITEKDLRFSLSCSQSLSDIARYAVQIRRILDSADAQVDGQGTTPTPGSVTPSWRPSPHKQVGGEDEQAGTSSSRAWYMLRQPTLRCLLLGLTQRLGKVINSSQPDDRVWTGVDEGGRLELDIAVESDTTGEIFVGFFRDPTWSAEPVQVRSFPRAGQYIVENLPPGKFQIGAMIGSVPVAAALGVQRTWPEPVEIAAGATSKADVLLSPEFEEYARGWYNPEFSRDFIGDWEDMDTDNLLQGRVTGPGGQPVPFATVQVREYNPGAMSIAAPNRGTNEFGYYKYDGMKWPYRVGVSRYKPMPSVFGYRYQYLLYNRIFRGPRTIDFQFDSFPEGDAKLSGRVLDQEGNPLKEFFISVRTKMDRDVTNNPDGKFYKVIGYRVPFISNDGTFELGGLPDGDFRVSVIPFQNLTYEPHRGEEISLVAGKTSTVQLNITTKNVFFGRVLFEDGSPAVVKPVPWPGAKTLIRMSTRMSVGSRVTGTSVRDVGELDDDGYFAVYLDDREIEQLKSGESQLYIKIPLAEQGRNRTAGKFPFSLLVERHDKAGAVKIERPRTDVQVEAAAKTSIGGKDQEHKQPQGQAEPSHHERSVTQLIAALSDENLQTRINAVYHLGYMGPEAEPAVSALVEALNQESLRESILHLLGNIGEGAEYAIPALIKAIAEYAPACRWHAAVALANIGEPAIAALETGTESENTYVRIWCNAALAKQKGSDSPNLSYLAKAAKSSDKRTAIEAVRALTMLGPISEPLVPDLIEALEHSVVPKNDLAFALAQIGKQAKPAVPELVELIQDKNLGTRADAIYALSRIGGSDAAPAVPFLIEALKTYDTSPVVTASRVRYTAATALGNIGPDARAAIPDLILTLRDKDEFVRANAAKAIGDIDPTDLQAVPALIEAMEDESGRVRVAASQTLVKIGPVSKPVILAFIKAADDNWKGVRYACDTFFTYLGPEHSYTVPDLIVMLKSPNERAQQLAVTALGNIGQATVPAVPNLAKTMKNPRLEPVAVGALRRLGPSASAAVPELIEMLKNKHKRFSAASVLEAIGPQAGEAIPGLQDCLGQGPSAAFARTLLAIDPKSAEAVDELVRIAESPYGPDQWTEQPDAHYLLVKYGHDTDTHLQGLIDALENPNARIRLSAAAYLGRLGAEANEAVDSLRKTLKDEDPEVRVEAARAVLMTDSDRKEAVSVILNSLDHAELMVRVRAAGALEALGPEDKQAAALLVTKVQDSDTRTRIALIRALGNIGPEARDALPLLKRLLRNEHWQIRQNAAQAIKRIDGGASVHVKGEKHWLRATVN